MAKIASCAATVVIIMFEKAVPPRPVDPGVDRLVGLKLRAYFDGLALTPAPPRIVALIRALAEKEYRERGDARK